jgi:hypothetical protein
MSALSTPIHEQLEQKKRRRKENKELIQMTKSGSFEMSETWSPKTWATARRNQVKHH